MIKNNVKILLNVFLVKKISFCLLFVTFCLGGRVIAAESQFLNNKQIRAELKKVDKPIIISGDFEQIKTIKDLDMSIKTTGLFEIQKSTVSDVKVVWKIKKPEQLNVCIDREKLIFENIALKKKTVLKIAEISNQDSSGLTKLINFIKLDPEDISLNFNIEKNKKTLLVTPKKQNSFSFARAEVELDKNKNLKNVSLFENSGDTLKIIFSNSKEKSFTVKPAEILCL